MTELPNELVEVIWLSPGTCPNCRSSGDVTEEAITSGIGARIKRHDLNGRIVHFRQRRNRQLHERNPAHQQHADHQQRRRNRPENKYP